MKTVSIQEVRDRVEVYGRSYYDETEKVLYSNYTCGSWEVRFKGTFLAVNFSVIPDTFVPPIALPPGKELPQKKDWPWISVFLDGEEEAYQKLPVRGETASVMLICSEQEEEHIIRIVKLTENFRTALGISGFCMEGELMAYQAPEKEVIEFIGDSITCGFGNDTREVNLDFYTADEDGYLSYGAIAARELGLESRFISVSGISLTAMPNMQGFYGMMDLYAYADRILEDKLAEKRKEKISSYRPFDFTKKPARYVVLNLGTNDGTQIYFCPEEEKEQAERNFEKNYYDFIASIREKNKEETKIICTLGCMDYYLYDNIRKIVERFKKDTKDPFLYLMKYTKMMNMGEDVGAAFHPSVAKHKKMARELVKFIRKLS